MKNTSHNSGTVSNIKGHRHQNSPTSVPSRRDGTHIQSGRSVQACGANRRSNGQMINHWNTCQISHSLTAISWGILDHSTLLPKPILGPLELYLLPILSFRQCCIKQNIFCLEFNEIKNFGPEINFGSFLALRSQFGQIK